MAELQLSVVSESESRRQIGAQISAWEENLERLHCEQFRLRCYMASLQHGELPNPKVKWSTRVCPCYCFGKTRSKEGNGVRQERERVF